MIDLSEKEIVPKEIIIKRDSYLLTNKKKEDISLLITNFSGEPVRDFLSRDNLSPSQILRRLGHFLESPLDRALTSPYTNRSFDEYLKLLGITKHELGTFVLDVGSGVDELFAREAQRLGIGVVSINPKLSAMEGREPEVMRELSVKDFGGDNSYTRKAVAALAQGLPFKSDCFDSVVSVYAVPYYVSRYDVPGVFGEVVRVLKPGGKAFFLPVFSDDLETYAKVLSEFPCSFNIEKATPAGSDYIFRLTIQKQHASVLAGR